MDQEIFWNEPLPLNPRWTQGYRVIRRRTEKDFYGWERDRLTVVCQILATLLRPRGAFSLNRLVYRLFQPAKCFCQKRAIGFATVTG
jgi:hypothetical protein